MYDTDLAHTWNDGGNGVDTQSATGSWLPPGATLNPDGSITLPNGRVMPAPPPGYERDPQTGVISYAHTPGTTPTPGLDPKDPNKPNAPWTAAAPPPTPQPVGDPGGVAPRETNTGLGSLFNPFGQNYNQPPPVNLGGPSGIPYIPPVPTLDLGKYEKPPAFQYKDFELPTIDEVNADPSMEMRRGLGQRGIESSAAAQGRVRTGGTLADIMKFNQGFASSEYGNVLGRKLGQYRENRGNAIDTYNTNYKTQYTDPWSFNEEAAKSAFAPIFSQWQTQGQAGQRQNELNNDQAWAQFLQKYREFDDQRKFKYGVLSDQERIGLGAATA